MKKLGLIQLPVEKFGFKVPGNYQETPMQIEKE